MSKKRVVRLNESQLRTLVREMAAESAGKGEVMTYRELIDMLNFYAGGNPERLDYAARIELNDGEFHEILGFRIDAESPNPHPYLYIRR